MITFFLFFLGRKDEELGVFLEMTPLLKTAYS